MRAKGVEQKHLVAAQLEPLPRHRLRAAPAIHIAHLHVIMHVLGNCIKARVFPYRQATRHAGLGIGKPWLPNLAHWASVDFDMLGHNRPIKCHAVFISDLTGAQFAEPTLELVDLHGLPIVDLVIVRRDSDISRTRRRVHNLCYAADRSSQGGSMTAYYQQVLEAHTTTTCFRFCG